MLNRMLDSLELCSDRRTNHDTCHSFHKACVADRVKQMNGHALSLAKAFARLAKISHCLQSFNSFGVFSGHKWMHSMGAAVLTCALRDFAVSNLGLCLDLASGSLEPPDATGPSDATDRVMRLGFAAGSDALAGSG